MNIQYIKEMKEIYKYLLDYFDDDDDFEDEYFENLVKLIDPHKREEFQTSLHLILEISKHHHRNANFFSKIERILIHFENKIKQNFSNSEIFELFKSNKRILYFLIKSKIIKVNEKITYLILSLSKRGDKKCHKYFFPDIKLFFIENWRKKIESELLSQDSSIFETFDEKCKLGENDSYICHLIRNDLVEEFISYVNHRNISLFHTTIKPSIFETNTFLIKNKNTNLIEYAAFFGSIQIFQFLRLNNVELTSSLWFYSIHGRNGEIIHMLEENHVQPPNNSYEECFLESVKCHHNEIADYFQNNFLNNQASFESSFHFYNFAFFPEKVTMKSCLIYSCKYNYLNIVKCLLKNEIDDEFCIKCLHSAASRNNFEIVNFLLTKYKKITPYLFKQYKKLTKITIPQSITKIGCYSFEGCESLKKIILPSSLKSIDYYSFYECKSLTKIEIPSSVTEIGNCAFERCESLKKVTIPSIEIINDKTFANCTSLNEIQIPNSVLIIGKNCFIGCKSIKQISIPKFVKSIREGSFSGCSSITEINIPSSLTKIEDKTFEECTSLQKVTIPPTVKKIGDCAFNKCISLNQISLPPFLSSIKKYCFNECKVLPQITIPSSVNEIKEFAFCGCASLKEITIPNSVTEIGSFAFNNCTSLMKIVIPNSVNYIGEAAFKNCSSLVDITIPSSISTISDSVFEGCSSIKEIIIPSSLIRIGSYSFYKCFSLENISFPESIRKIGYYSFCGCLSLKKISIPLSVTSIGFNAFDECTSLTQISIPEKFISLKSKIGIGNNVITTIKQG